MKKTLLILLTYGLTQALFCQHTTQQKLDALMDAYCKVNKFNGSVLVSQKGKILLEKGYGIKNFQSKTMNDEHSIFQIYSITKTFTSTVILKLVELKKLSLSDKLSKFYPEFPKGDSITIENLLTHTSGIYDYTHGNNMPDQSEKSFLAFLAAKLLDFSPGSNWSYSNSGYYLLGFIIKKITGISYEMAVRKYIFTPLEMKNSGFDFKNLSNKNKTTGYSVFSEETKKEVIPGDSTGPFSAGAIYSTVGDLFKYHSCLQEFSVIKKASLEKAYLSFKNNYGYGWIIKSYEGKKMVSHSGGFEGYRSNLARIPEDDICIVVLNNNENANVEILTKKILDILYNKPYKTPFEIKLSKEVLKKYTGTYQVATPPLVMYITVEDGRLVAQASGQQKTIVLAQKENYFFAEEADGFLEFLKNEDGIFNELIIHQGGQDITGKRIYPTWGLIGTATSKGWEANMPDIKFTEDALKRGLWVLSNITLSTGELKFRFNNDWNINYGDNGNDTILDMYGENIKIEAGTYDIILDFSDEAKPKYSVNMRK